MVPEEPRRGPERHASLDDRFDPAIRIVDYDANWAAEAEVELSRIKKALGPLAVRLEHVGSTAVAGLAAKPVIDLQVSVVTMEPPSRYVGPLERLGYLFVPDPASPDLHFFAKPRERPRSHHLHACAPGGHHEFRHLAVRDFLRSDTNEAAKYAALKRRLRGGIRKTASPTSPPRTATSPNSKRKPWSGRVLEPIKRKQSPKKFRRRVDFPRPGSTSR